MIENAINITHRSVSQGVTAYYRDAHCFAIAPMQAAPALSRSTDAKDH
jgi:hypothetical protein